MTIIRSKSRRAADRARVSLALNQGSKEMFSLAKDVKNLDVKNLTNKTEVLAKKGLDVGGGLLNFGENIVGDLVNNAEAIAEGAVDLVLPDAVSGKLKKDYIKSYIIELLPILVFITYIFYYQSMQEHYHKLNYLW